MGYILGALAVVTIASVYAYLTYDNYERRNSRNPLLVMSQPTAWVAGITFLVGSIVYPISYAESVSSNAQLVAYAEKVHPAYVQTVRQTAAIESTAAATLAAAPIGTMIFDSASWEQNKVTATRLAELRDKVTWYNVLLAGKIAWNDNWFLSLLIAPVPVGLEPIEFPAE